MATAALISDQIDSADCRHWRLRVNPEGPLEISLRRDPDGCLAFGGVVGVVLIVSSFALHSSYPDLETTTCSVGLAEVGIVCLDIYLLSSSSVG